MGRLIDADRMKDVLDKNFGHTSGAVVLANLIDMQPTAYDVEAVVDELNAKGNEFFAKAVNAEIKGECLFAEICKMAASAVYESADIVKRGGQK